MIVNLIKSSLELLKTAVILKVILNLLTRFKVLNEDHKGVNSVLNSLSSLINPILILLKEKIPFLVIKNLDTSPVILILIINILQKIL